MPNTNPTRIALARKIVVLDPGTYHGLWSGYTITLDNGVQIETVDGVRSLDGVPCTVVADGLLSATVD